MERPKNRFKPIAKTIAKIAFSAVALYYVFSKIDIYQLKQLFTSVDPGWLLPAGLFFLLSKVTSSFRLNAFFRAIGLVISEKYNLRLYAVGMYYNLFLPGGIGGDGYKVYLLNKQHQEVKLKALISATVLDRISGLYALVVLALVLGWYLPEYVNGQSWILLSLIMVSIPLYHLFIRLFFKAMARVTVATVAYSFAVQGLQLISAYCILKALHVVDQVLVYQFVFLMSSVVAVFPFTIGGVGARELTFVLSHDYLGINENTAVAFSLIFFLITAVTSFAGAFMSVNRPD